MFQRFASLSQRRFPGGVGEQSHDEGLLLPESLGRLPQPALLRRELDESIGEMFGLREELQSARREIGTFHTNSMSH